MNHPTINTTIYSECIPCILRQIVEASLMGNASIKTQQKILIEVMELLKKYPEYEAQPILVKEAQAIVAKLTQNPDVYADMKNRHIATAKRMLPIIKDMIKHAEDPFYATLKAAVIGNVLDAAIAGEFDLANDLKKEYEAPFVLNDIESLSADLKHAKHVLIIGDNAGETVFDTILLEALKDKQLTYAVRENNILNDATIKEAKDSDIDTYAALISSGCSCPGTVLSECSQTFLDTFYKADVVIAKGQGNYEGLHDCDRKVYFLLKAKCTVLAKMLDVPMGSYVITCKTTCDR